MAVHRFLYHSFPRRPGKNRFSRGLQVLAGILDQGLLLTPETIRFHRWRQWYKSGPLSSPQLTDKVLDSCVLSQTRACFTELAPHELPRHAKQFGPFALEWDARDLRQMGAMPVFYVPLDRPQDGMGRALLGTLFDISDILDKISRLCELADRPGPPTDGVYVLDQQGKAVISGRGITAGGLKEVMQFIQFHTRPVAQLHCGLAALSAHFYPTENLKYTGDLAYYKQREWRIVGTVDVFHDGKAVLRPPTHPEVAALSMLDPGFFSKRIEFAGRTSSIAEECRYFQPFGDMPIGSFVRRIVAPMSSVPDVKRMLRARHQSIKVVALENLA